MTATRDNDLFCPVHREVKADIDRIERVQESRHCISHEVQILALEDGQREQWVEINKLKRLVYLGMGIISAAAFFGSIMGNLLINYLRK